MKAAVYDSYGPPEVVKIADIPRPEPSAQQVLVKVHAGTVNRTDCGFRSAEYFITRLFSGLFNPKIKVLGCEFAGVVESVGDKVEKFAPGDKVFGFNDMHWGGHAEYILLQEKDAFTHIPPGLSMDMAAALTEGAHYALCYIRAAKIKQGDKVLVNGGTGAIGSAAIQLLKYFGANVTAVCDTEYMQVVADLGADRVIDYTKEDFTQLNESFDMVFDAVGKSTFGKTKRLLKKNGKYASTELGPRGENPFLALLGTLKKGKKVLFPLPFIRLDDVEFIAKISAEKRFSPLIDRAYSLDQIVDAYRYVDSGQKRGNVIISMTLSAN
ncbi:MAG: NAD(P)-dependent alcohol dehydrogenase [Cyclobacteriaceae bacterium]|nr:NAD(P)-dependent alcohol dehydrogenase [Cyclobacteriaceae bacterium]